MVIQNPEAARRAQQERSRVALEVVLIAYALVATLVLMRTVLVLLDVSDRVWIGKMILGPFSIVTDPLSRLPGFGVELLGNLTFVDLLLLAVVVLFPLGLVATSGRR